MASSKREVWEAAQKIGVDGFISAVSRAFPGAIEAVAVSGKGVGVVTTDDRLLHMPVMVKPGAGLDHNESKRIRDAHKNNGNMRYKGEKKR